MSSASGTKKRRKQVEIADDLDVVMRKCRKLKEELRQKASKSEETRASEEELGEVPPGIVEVTELSSTEVLEGIEAVAVTIASQVMACKGFTLDIPSRASSVCFIMNVATLHTVDDYWFGKVKIWAQCLFCFAVPFVSLYASFFRTKFM